MKNELNIRSLLKSLGYDFSEKTPPAYRLALSLYKVGFDRDRIIQIVSISYPIELKL